MSHKAEQEKPLKKQCDCKGTSSGPRFIMPRFRQQFEHVNTNEVVRITGITGFVAMACDVCDTPWRAEGEKQ